MTVGDKIREKINTLKKLNSKETKRKNGLNNMQKKLLEPDFTSGLQ